MECAPLLEFHSYILLFDIRGPRANTDARDGADDASVGSTSQKTRNRIALPGLPKPDAGRIASGIGGRFTARNPHTRGPEQIER